MLLWNQFFCCLNQFPVSENRRSGSQLSSSPELHLNDIDEEGQKVRGRKYTQDNSLVHHRAHTPFTHTVGEI